MKIEEKERITCKKDFVYLRIDGDFANKKDEATFYYSYDNEEWKQIGEPCKMVLIIPGSLWGVSSPYSIMRRSLWEVI